VNQNAKNPQHENRRCLVRMVLKLCCGLGAHDVRVPGFIYSSSCCCLQAIFTSKDFTDVRALRKAIADTDPGNAQSLKHTDITLRTHRYHSLSLHSVFTDHTEPSAKSGITKTTLNTYTPEKFAEVRDLCLSHHQCHLHGAP
jgi:hypothetical protein